MSDLRINNITDRTADSGPVIAGVSTVSSTGSFVVPSGATEYRGGRGRGVFGGGYKTPSPGVVSTMSYVEIATTGNSTDFGDVGGAGSTGSSSSATRGVFNHGDVPNSQKAMYYVNISSQGGASYFAELSYVTRDGPFGGGDRTRGILGGSAGGPSNMGGSPGQGVNYIDYITFATTANSNEFGDLTIKRRGMGACSSLTRTVFGGGYIKPQSHTKIVDVVTTQTKGDATHFGDLTLSRGHMGGFSSQTRGCWYGGSIYPGSSYTLYNVIDYVTIASEGNATDFGDTTNASSGLHFTTGTASNKIRGLVGGTNASPTALNNIDYVMIATTGNATDFGDLTEAHYQTAGASDSHGGLG